MFFSCARVSADAVGRMIRRRACVTALLASCAGLSAPAAFCADLPFWTPPAPAAAYRWEGGYFGANVGYLHGTGGFGITGFPDGAFAGLIPPIPPTTRATVNDVVEGVQAGYLHQIGALVIGFEQDVILGTPTVATSASGTASGFPYTLTQQQTINWLATMRARVGFAPNDQFLLYATGGLAVGGVTTGSTLTFNLPGGIAYLGGRNDFRAGWAAGVGVEYALTSQFSATLEYLHVDLGHVTVAGIPNVPVVFEVHTDANVSADIVRAGINYRFDRDGSDFQRDVGRYMPQFVRSLDTELGLRYWYSTGRTAKDLYGFSGATMLSRLTYDGLGASSGEGFVRINDHSGFFVKGTIGAGAVTSGSLKDEDFPPGINPYSATASAQRDGNLFYLTGDAGYDFWTGPNYKLGAFVGFFHERELLNAHGCAQVASNPFVCQPAISDPILGITEDARWFAARVGLSGEVTLWNRLRLGADAAWLPYVRLTGTDAHWLRMQSFDGNFIGPVREDGNGFTGVQLEAIVSYLISPDFSVGVGARYWRMETNGHAHFEDDIYGGGGGPQPIHFVSERYGGFVQAAFKF
jgi:opacity protein-like surface antigen